MVRSIRNRISFSSGLAKKRTVGLVLLVVILGLFLSLNRFPKLDTIRGDLDTVTAPRVECFQGFCIEAEPETGFLTRWVRFSVEYLRNVTVGMTFAFLVAGLTEAFLFPRSSGSTLATGGILRRTFRGLALGPVWNLCSACIAPVSASFRRRGAGIEGAIAMVQGSSTLNLPALVMAAIIFTPVLGGSRIVMGLLGGLLIGPLVAIIVHEKREEAEPELDIQDTGWTETSTWASTMTEGFRDWAKASIRYFVQMGPIMAAAGFASGLIIQWVSPDTISQYLGNHAGGIAIAATLGILINVPLMFEIPLVALLLLLGMGAAPAATLLFAAAAGGPVTFWSLSRVIPRKGIAAFVTATWAIALVGGLAVWGLGSAMPGLDIGLKPSVASSSGADRGSTTAPDRRAASILDGRISPSDSLDSVSTVFYGVVPGDVGAQPARYIPFTVGTGEPGTDFTSEPVIPFENVAAKALLNGYEVWNDRPGVAIFDFDRDSDLDFYLTSDGRHPNWLYRNEGDGTFIDVAEEAGVTASNSHSTGVVACDIDNDGFQDLYVGAWGDPNDMLDFRSPPHKQGNADTLFVNNGDGTFRDVTQTAFTEDINLRSAASIACGDVDGDGWLDLFVGNLAAEDFRLFEPGNHPGHYNVLYRNNGNLTFTDISQEAGVRGPQVFMRDLDGKPILYRDSSTDQTFEGYDPSVSDRLGNPVGEPTGQTHSVALFDYDDDNDLDLFVANDGDRFHVYRNESSPGEVRFTAVEGAMGVDTVGAWMGLAVGDYDGDADLDLFVTNAGFHALQQPPKTTPRGTCDYHMRLSWGTCLHFLLRNDGRRQVLGFGTVADFKVVSGATTVHSSPLMPPRSLDPSTIHPAQEVPTGLGAYDFGFGASFFDYDNDGDQDLYWLGSTVARGEAPGGKIFPGAGRMLRGNGRGSFEDITVRARLLDIAGVDYSSLDTGESRLSPEDLLHRRIDPSFHENGKGLAHGDLNGDGYVDLIGTNSSGEQFTRPLIVTVPTQQVAGPTFVWMNGGGDNHWIKLRLKGRMAIDGTGSNADGIGARVYIQSSQRVQVQEVRAGSSYLSMDSVELEFGLGTATSVDRIVVFWPSGRVQTSENLEADQSIVVVEPAE